MSGRPKLKNVSLYNCGLLLGQSEGASLVSDCRGNDELQRGVPSPLSRGPGCADPSGRHVLTRSRLSGIWTKVRY